MNIANVLTGSRIVLSFSLLLFQPLSLIFLFVYVVCGLTDGLDGFFARKMKTKSKVGASLDSVADVCFLLVVVVQLVPVIELPMKLIIWICLIAFIRVIALLVAAHKFHAFTFLHTYANKCTGLLLFCVPLLLPFMDSQWIAVIVCIVATFSVTEELIINTFSEEWNADIHSVVDLL